MKIVRFSGLTALVVLGIIFLFLIAAAILALKIIIWLLPVVIIVVAAWVLIYIFNRPKKKSDHIDAEFRIKG